MKRFEGGSKIDFLNKICVNGRHTSIIHCKKQCFLNPKLPKPCTCLTETLLEHPKAAIPATCQSEPLGDPSYRRRAVWHPHLISQAAGAADFQGRRGYPNVRLFVAAGVARFKAAGALRIFKAAGVTQMYGFSWPPGLPENRRSYRQRAVWDLHLTSQAAGGRGQRPTSQPASLPACSNDSRMALASAGTEEGPRLSFLTS